LLSSGNYTNATVTINASVGLSDVSQHPIGINVEYPMDRR
jgi:hypothetical protein